jgi:muramoyltetrapeptide carboxypeptidase
MTNILLPPFLQPGDAVDIVATARWIERDVMQQACDVITAWGLRPRVNDQVYTRQHQLAGNAETRRAALQMAMDAKDSRAVLIARGGYGTVHLLDGLDLSGLAANPKWICGYSDITALHAHLFQNIHLPGIHSTMPVSFPVASSEALECLRVALMGESMHFNWPDTGPDKEVHAPVVGGNLSVLYSLLGSGSFPTSRPHILFLEDVDEMLYHVDRMMMALLRAGALSYTKAILVGGFTQMKDNTKEHGFASDNPWGSTPETIVDDLGIRLGIPIFKGFPAGHINDNRAFYLGISAVLCRLNQRASLTFQTTRQE